jgi:hypothetical protein
MGLFTSVCPGCLSAIDWFIHVPQDYVCEDCGRSVTPEEIQYSFHNQVHNNPDTVAYLEGLTCEELQSMVDQVPEKAPKHKAIKSPRTEDDFYVISGHFFLLQRVYKEKCGE